MDTKYIEIAGQRIAAGSFEEFPIRRTRANSLAPGVDHEDGKVTVVNGEIFYVRWPESLSSKVPLHDRPHRAPEVSRVERLELRLNTREKMTLRLGKGYFFAASTPDNRIHRIKKMVIVG